jgi:hypothetical protein
MFTKIEQPQKYERGTNERETMTTRIVHISCYIYSTQSRKSNHIRSSKAIHPLVGPWPLLQFHNLFDTGGRTPWASDQPVARSLPTCGSTQTQNKRTETSMP